MALSHFSKVTPESNAHYSNLIEGHHLSVEEIQKVTGKSDLHIEAYAHKLMLISLCSCSTPKKDRSVILRRTAWEPNFS